jgi:hypothetical protein
MSQTTTINGEQLAHALRALGVNFIIGEGEKDQSLHKQPARLIAALADSKEARLRLSLISLFLEHPEFASHARVVVESLSPSAQLTLQCYYTAAVWLGQIYKDWDQSLPDHFSKELGLVSSNDPEENLRALAERHKELSGVQVDWLGTYSHAARVWLKGLEYQKP